MSTILPLRFFLGTSGPLTGRLPSHVDSVTGIGSLDFMKKEGGLGGGG